jgi:hypothetical protein
VRSSRSFKNFRRKFAIKMTEFQKSIDSILRTNPTKWWIHETVLCKTTNIRARDGKSVRQWLTLILSSIKKSYIGNKKDGISTGYPAIDLMSSQINQFGIHCLQHGDTTLFSTAGDLSTTKTSVTAKPRYFCLEVCFFRTRTSYL